MPVGCHASHFDPIGELPPILDGLPLMAGDRVGLIPNFDASPSLVRSTYFGPSGMAWAIVVRPKGGARAVPVMELMRLEEPS